MHEYDLETMPQSLRTEKWDKSPSRFQIGHGVV